MAGSYDTLIKEYISHVKKLRKNHSDCTFKEFAKKEYLMYFTDACEMIMYKKRYLIETYRKILDISETQDNIKPYAKQDIFVLRPYRGEETLVIGCGNYSGSRFNRNKCPCENCFMLDAEKHDHSSHYTIDPDLGMNPSVCGRFGKHLFQNIPDNSFGKIIIEGINHEYVISEMGFDELKRIAKNNAIIFSDRAPILMKVEDSLLNILAIKSKKHDAIHNIRGFLDVFEKLIN